MSVQEEWFVARNGQPTGPFAFGELLDVARQGQLGRDDLVWREGLDTWVPASAVPGLYGPPPLPANSVVLPPTGWDAATREVGRERQIGPGGATTKTARSSRGRTAAQAVLTSLLTLLAVSIAILNFGGGIVGGIWLGLIGQWILVAIGVFALVISMSTVRFALMPGMLFQVPGLLALERGRPVVAGLSIALGNLWDLVVVGSWCFAAFFAVVSNWSHGSAWPYLLWGYGVATGPWTFLAAREPQNLDPDSPPSTSMIAVFAACVGTMAMMAVVLVMGEPNPADLLLVLSVPLVVGFGVSCALLCTFLRRQ